MTYHLICRIIQIYGDDSAIIRPVVKNGYIIYRLNNISGATKIEALDKYENVIYHGILLKLGRNQHNTAHYCYVEIFKYSNAAV